MRSARIMVVEDEWIVAFHLQQQLIRLGYEVPAVAASGERAMASIRELRPDLVLMDVHLDGDVDGIEAAARLDAEFATPVVYLTAYSEETTLARARATRPYGYLVKPFTERELHATIQMALERRQAEEALRQSEERLRLALDAAQMGSWELDATTCRLMRVGQADQIFGLSQEVLSGSWESFLKIVHEDDRAMVERELGRLFAEAELCQLEFRSLHADGSVRWFKVQGKGFPPRGASGRRIVGVVQDVTERRLAEERLRQAATVFEATNDGILILDRDLQVLSVNQGYCQMIGQSESKLLGHRPYLLTREAHPAQLFEAFSQGLAQEGQWRGEIRAWGATGDEFPALMNIAAVTSARGEVTHHVAVLTDMTAVRKAEEQLQRLAHYDPVTELPNRLLAGDRLSHALESASRHHGRAAAMFVDLDQFKNINDTLGHGVGDELLRLIAQRMAAVVRGKDTVARYGGDEFLVILDDIDQPEHAAVVANNLLSAVAAPLSLAGRELSISASIGISLSPEDGATREDLIRAADTAMYAAKESGRGRYAFHTPHMTANAMRYLALDQDLRRGVEQGELVLHYQPQISLRDGRIIGVEALIRRQHPQRGLLGADQVVPLAEQNGLITEVGRWVLRRACEQTQEWRAAGLPELRLAVNVSARQMQDQRLIDTVFEALRVSGLSPSQLEIEITESTLQNEYGSVLALNQLKDLGVTLAIDDFGTGYSCLSSLKVLPINRVKIDRSFVRDVPDDCNDAAIVEAIIAMAHKLNLSIIAEGVETGAQEQFLRAHECDEAQGYLYAPPLAPGDLADFVQARC